MNWITNGVDEERVISTLQNELESLRTQMAQEMELGNVSDDAHANISENKNSIVTKYTT